MTNHDNREQLWQAYLDGELSACEAAQFETTLSEAERRRLAAELRFDRALADRLRQHLRRQQTAGGKRGGRRANPMRKRFHESASNPTLLNTE